MTPQGGFASPEEPGRQGGGDLHAGDGEERVEEGEHDVHPQGGGLRTCPDDGCREALG